MKPTPQPTGSLRELLEMVRDAGAVDDNHGAEDWTFSDNQIDQALAQLEELIEKRIIGEDENEEVRRLYPEAYHANNGLRAEQRANLKALIKEG